RIATLVVNPAAGATAITFTMSAGPVATAVEMSAGDDTLRFQLGAGERRDLSIPVRPGNSTMLRIRAEQGFRPSAVDPKSTDMRLLGVRLEFR
ncbi:MAG: hypothetical protein NTY02_01545, partial [Acidobacteria bacterium]|nr:hypothetical protein [Acidobacteriota bacterium]